MPRRLSVDPVAARFGRVIRSLRQQHAWTVAQLARKVDLSSAYITALEYGYNMPTLKVILSLATALGVDPGALVNKVVTPPRTASLDQVP